MQNNPKKTSTFDLLYWLVQDKKIKPDIFFQFLDFFWPSFIQKEKYVFLKEQYSEEKFQNYVKTDDNIEYWLNFLTVDCFFLQEENGEKKASKLAQVLVEIWDAKLKKEFPKKKFVVQYLYDTKTGDYGLTFYQEL